MTNLRVLGYQFNPASFYLCRDAAGALACVVVEVHNTYGERHLYTLRPEQRRRERRPFSAAMDKEFFVSPFIGPDGALPRHRARRRRRLLAIGINEREDRRAAARDEPDAAAPAADAAQPDRLLLRYPLVTHKTTALIHWHALRLWLKGVPFHRHVAARSTARPHDGAAMSNRTQLGRHCQDRAAPGRPCRGARNRRAGSTAAGRHA